MEHYVQYHNADVRGFSCFELSPNEGFSIVTNKALAKTKLVGNRVWLIGGEGKPRRYYLCLTFIVEQVEEIKGEFQYLASGQKGQFFDPPIFLNDLPWFKDFLHSQQNFSMGLRKIKSTYVAALQKISKQPSPTIAETLGRESGAGFGTPETNRKVEQAAISLVMADYQRRGWTVQSVELQKRGYDLICTRGNQRELVEVKGIQGRDLSFIMTAKEVKQANSNDEFVLCVVTSALSAPKIHRFTAQAFRTRFDLKPISYRATLKQKK